MEISELKNKLIKMKNSADEFHRRMEGQRKELISLRIKQ